jgi:SAM-dependent methyltransferase
VIDAKAYYASLPKESVPCELCDSTDFETLHEGDRYEMGLTLVRCRQCGLVFINPRPVKAAMDQFYTEAYRLFYEEIEVPTLDYIQGGVYTQRAEHAVSMLQPYYTGRTGHRSLDVGCAEGSLLRALGKQYSLVNRSGLEPNAAFADFARTYSGAPVFTGSWEAFRERHEERYDLITVTHVLEHCLQPLVFLKQVRASMRDDAVAYIEVPNVGAACGLPQLHLAHLYLFFPETFLPLLARAGFDVLEFKDEGLPALCPSMAAVVKKGSERVLERTAEQVERRIESIRNSLQPAECR